MIWNFSDVLYEITTKYLLATSYVSSILVDWKEIWDFLLALFIYVGMKDYMKMIENHLSLIKIN